MSRAIVNFDGPIVFCMVSRYHGGSLRRFLQAINERHRKCSTIKRSFSSVIGGTTAERGVHPRGEQTHRSGPGRSELKIACSLHRRRGETQLAVKLAATRAAVRSDKLGEVAAEFEAVPQRRAGPPDGLGPLGSFRRLN